MLRVRPRTLRGRLALFYAAALAAVLLTFSAVVYLVAVRETDEEPMATIGAEPPDRGGTRLLVAVAVALPIALLVAGGGALLIARRGLSPLDAIVELAGGLGAEDLSRRIRVADGAGDEIVTLVTALNAMLDRLERSVGGMRRFTADASHELRTPIAALMGEVELALTHPRDPAELRVTLGGALEQLADLSRLIEGLLVLARSDAGKLPLAPEEVDVSDMARRVCEPYEAVAVERGIELRLEPSPRGGARVKADPLWLGRALANLVDNACKFTASGGRVTVAVSTDEPKGVVEVRVTDTAPTVPVEERERLFERFYRSASTRGTVGGFGLGLPIAREIVVAHGGRLTLGSNDTGGNVFTIALPRQR